MGLPDPEWEWAHRAERLLGRPWPLLASSPTWVLSAHTELVWEGPAESVLSGQVCRDPR